MPNQTKLGWGHGHLYFGIGSNTMTNLIKWAKRPFVLVSTDFLFGDVYTFT